MSVERLPHPPDKQLPQSELTVIRPPLLAKVLGAILAALLLVTIGAAMVVGLITFTVFFLLVVSLLLLLPVAAFALRRGRFSVYVVRRFGPQQQGTDRPPGHDPNP